MNILQLAEIINQIAPFELAQDWDNVGLLLGDYRSELKGVMLAIDITASVADEAIKNDCNCIIGYHPVIWEPLKKITKQCPRNIVYKLLQNGINVISTHTALDSAEGGVNDALAEAAGLTESEPIGDFVSPSNEDSYKLVVFVPLDNINAVSKAVFDAGAGAMGNYSNCGFTTEGIGSFLPLAGANPAIGSIEKLEKVQEVRFETIVKGSNLAAVVDAMKVAHKYEMPAYDIIKLDLLQKRLGIGRIGKLQSPRHSIDILADIKALTAATTAGIIGEQKPSIEKLAVCAGSCGSIINKVVAAGCDMYITGELKHHDALIAKEAGLLCVCLGHSFSERFRLARLRKKIALKAPDIKLMLSEEDKDPFIWQKI